MDGLYRLDMAVFRGVNVGWHTPLLDPVFWVVSSTGLGWVQILFVLLLARWPATRRFVVPCLATVALTGIAFADLIKLLIPRDRPSLLRIALPQENVHHMSFVSGHSTTAFALATMILLMTLGTRQARTGWLAILWAVAVAFSRVYRGVHWPSDTIAGACAGALGSATLYLVFAARGWLDLTLERRSSSTPPLEAG